MSVAVIFGHADKIDVVRRVVAAVKVGEVPVGEGLGDFDSAVSAEVKIDEGVAFLDLADGLVEVVDDDEGLEVLVLNGGIDAVKDV